MLLTNQKTSALYQVDNWVISYRAVGGILVISNISNVSGSLDIVVDHVDVLRL